MKLMLSWTLNDIAAALGCDGPDEGGDLEITGISTDTRQLRPGELFVAVDGPNFRGRDFLEAAFERGAVAAVAASGPAAGPICTAGPLLAVDDGAAALMRLGRAMRERLDIPVVGITGSVGKTSTKDALATILASEKRVVAARASFNNRIGVPLTLARVEPSTEVAVLEIGTSLPGEIRALTTVARPHVAVVTAIAEAHLEGLGSIEGVLAEKLSIREGLVEGGSLLLNGEDPRLAPRVRELGARSYGFSAEADFRAHAPEVGADGVSFRLSPQGPVIRAALVGRHNLLNLLAAASVARLLGMSEEAIAAAAPAVAAPRLRWQRREIATPRGGRAALVLDCYNANPASMRAALATFAAQQGRGRAWLILGDMAELGAASASAHRELLEEVRAEPRFADAQIVLVGPAMSAAGAIFGDREGVATANATAEVSRALESLGGLADGDSLLVKGSRSMALEDAFAAEEGTS
jgi:UDP-N-acetylmuramoyl-tripeptide--D-alanyl-D-alanine ligase